jgi:hypothetical protein
VAGQIENGLAARPHDDKHRLLGASGLELGEHSVEVAFDTNGTVLVSIFVHR